MMPMSQIDMVVVLKEPSIDGATLRVCGRFEPEPGRPSQRPEVHVVVQQGDIVAKGQKAVDDNSPTWTVEVGTDPPQQFIPGQPAIACGVIIVEKEPAGLEALSWVQEVNVLPRDTIRTAENERFVFPPAESVVSLQGGQLPSEHAVSSSLAFVPASDEPLSWHHKVEIRLAESAPVLPPETDSPLRSE
jgi:hypothetical protein